MHKPDYAIILTAALLALSRHQAISKHGNVTIIPQNEYCVTTIKLILLQGQKCIGFVVMDHSVILI